MSITHQTQSAEGSPLGRLTLLITERSQLGVWRALRETWQFREMAFFLVRRDLSVRYRQTVLRGAWGVIQPLTSMLVLTLFFGKGIKIPSDGLPYAIFSYAGLVPWTYFSSAVFRGSTCVAGNAFLINKVYFPRLMLPITAVLPGLFDYGIAFLAYIPLALHYGVRPSPFLIVALPLLTFLMTALAFGLSLCLSALHVRIRDVAQVMPMLVQLWMFGTPIVYPLNRLPAKIQPYIAINPMVGIIEGFRSALFGRPWQLQPLAFSVAVTILLIVTGLLFFRRTERYFADLQ